MNCPECQAAMVRSPSGVVCPNGHGKVVPMTAERAARERAKKLAAEKRATLPKAKLLEWLCVDDTRSICKRYFCTGRIYKRDDHRSSGESIEAILFGRTTALRRDENTERNILALAEQLKQEQDDAK